MSKSKNPTSTAKSTPVNPASPQDAALAATFIPSTRKERGWVANGVLAETYSNPKMQASLRKAEKELALLGLDVNELITTANEAALVYGSMVRLDESAGRAHQRVVELNRRMSKVQTQLLGIRSTAAPGTAIAEATRGLAGLRQKQVTEMKKARTKAQNAKQTAAKPTGTG